MRVSLLFTALFLTGAPALAGPVALTCPAGSTLVELKPGQFSCKHVVDDPKPIKRPRCRSGERLKTRTAADVCHTAAVPPETRKPTCKSGWSYKSRRGQDTCEKYSPTAGNLSANPSCTFFKPGGIPDIWPYQVQDGTDACLKQGTGTAAKTRSLPSEPCRHTPIPTRLKQDLRDAQDWCAAKGTKVVYTTPQQGGRTQAVRR